MRRGSAAWSCCTGGDLDTHGFHILDQLRSHHPHARSIVMDQETLLAHRDFWVREDSPSHAAGAPYC